MEIIKKNRFKKLIKKKTVNVNARKFFLDFLKNPSQNKKDKQKVLHLACSFHNEEILTSLVDDVDINLDEADENGQSAIFHAVVNTSTDCFNILLQRNVDLNIIDNDGKSILIYAIETNQFNIVEKLMHRITSREVFDGAIRFVIESKKSEALAILADYENIELKDFYGDIGFVDKKQYTALHYASKRGFVTAVSKLIFAGWRISQRNIKETPIALAYSYNQYKVVSMLLTAGLFINTDLKLLLLKSVKWILNINSPTKGSCESLHGKDFLNLLQELKTYEKCAMDGDELYIVCQNMKDHLEVLDTFQLKEVKHLVLINCNLKHVPCFKNIKRLALISCTVDNYDNLEQLQELQVLTISGSNELCELPEPLQQCQKLVHLNVNNNVHLTRLPSWILNLPLVYLSAHENNLTEIPELLPKSLRVLLISRNKIEKLSPFLGELPKLSFVSLHCNPLVFPELSIAKSKTKDLLLYLKAFLTDTVPNNTVKISFVGQERAGKSTLLEAIKSPKGMCEDTVDIHKTDGLEISNFTLNGIQLRAFDLAGDIDFIETHTMFISEGTLFLAVFDLRSYTLNSLSSYFFGRLEIWLSSIYAQAPHSRVILVGTHSDGEMITPSLLESVWQNILSILIKARSKHLMNFHDNPFHRCLLCCSPLDCMKRTTIDGVAGCVTVDNTDNDVNSKLMTADDDTADETCKVSRDNNVCINSVNEGESDNVEDPIKDGLYFPHIVGYYEVSNLKQMPRKVFSQKNISIEQLKEEIYRNASDILSQNPKIPRKWFNLQEILVKKVEKNYPIIFYQEFADIAYDCGFNADSSDQELEPFLRHFHSCGELLYYFDIDELCDIIIIDPQWLSNQLRSVISYRKSHLVDDGVIKHKQLYNTWKGLDEIYQRKLISLLRQAGVFITFSDDSDLVPCLLPVGKPSDDIWPIHSTENQVDYLFRFENLPPSFFSHVIAMVENKRGEFGGKMQPLYYSNHVVYITRSAGIPCEFHTKNEVPTIHSEDGVLDHGVNLARFLSLNVGSVDSLLDAGRDSKRFSAVISSDTSDFISIQKCESPRHRIHIELKPHTKRIIVSVRGPTPCCIAPETIDILNRIRLIRYNDITMNVYILCPYCVQKSIQNPSKFWLKDIENIEPVCVHGHDLKTWENVLTGKCDYQPSLTVERVIASLNDYDCPRLFLMIPVNLHSVGVLEFYTLSYLKEGYSVHLLCEYPKCWHFLSTPGYRLTRPKEFVKKYGRRLQTLLRVLSKLEVLPRIAGLFSDTGNNIADLFASFDKLAVNLDKHLSDFKDQWKTFTNNALDEDLRYLNSNDGLKRREFRRFLNKADEGRQFGDLIPTFIGDHVHWLCEEHYRLQVVHK